VIRVFLAYALSRLRRTGLPGGVVPAFPRLVRLTSLSSPWSFVTSLGVSALAHWRAGRSPSGLQDRRASPDALRSYGLIDCAGCVGASLTCSPASSPGLWGSFPYHCRTVSGYRNLGYRLGQLAVAGDLRIHSMFWMGMTVPASSHSCFWERPENPAPAALYGWEYIRCLRQCARTASSCCFAVPWSQFT